MFLRAMAWKELREQRLQALILTALGVLILAVVFPLFGEDVRLRENVPAVAVVFAWAGGMVTGALALANERELHTQTFLDGLPRRRLQVWSAKLFVALLLVLAQASALTATSWAVAGQAGPAPGLDHPAVLWMAAVLAGAYGLGCGLLGSALADTVLAAIGWAVVAAFGTGAVVGAGALLLTVVVESLTRLPDEDAERLGMLAWMIVLPLPAALSALIYSGLDRKRRYDARLLTPPRLRLAPSGLGLRSTLWLSLRQGWPLVAGLAVFAAAAGFLCVLVDPLIVWPVATLLIGLLMGVATLADEQFYGAFKFLADQRLPLGRLWLFKVGSRFLLAVGLCVVGAAAVWLGYQVAGAALGRVPEARWEYDLSGVIIRQAGAGLTISLWGLYGFAFGHLAAMLARKSVIALAIALAAAFVGLSVWLPSLVGGGLPAWQVLAVPLGLLVLARLSVWAWASERLLTRRWVLAWGAAAAAWVVFIAACGINRVHEVPAAPAPAGIAEFEAGYPERGENPVRAKLFLAEERFRTGFGRRLYGGYPAPRAADEAPPHATRGRLGGDRVLLALMLGWPKDDAAERRLAEEMLRGDWLAPLLGAAAEPQMPVDLPRDEALQPESVSRRARDFGPWLAFRALHLQALGRHAEALDVLAAELALARQLMTRATRSAWQSGLSVEASALYGLQRWADHAALPADLLPRALTELRRHEADRPPYDDMIRAEYLRLREYQAGLANPFEKMSREDERWKRSLIQSAVLAPWEKARRERLLNAYIDMQALVAGVDYPTLLERSRHWRKLDPRQGYLLSIFPPDEAEGSGPARRLSGLLVGDVLFGHLARYGLESFADAGRFVGLCQARALQLRLALQIFRHRRGRPADELAELVPEILPALPLDPFSEEPFRYRLLMADEWVAWHEDARLDGGGDWAVEDAGGMAAAVPLPLPMGGAGLAAPAATFRPVAAADETATHRRLPKGTGLLWSVGPDGADNGARHQYHFDLPGRSVRLLEMSGYDMLFPVPPR